MDKKAQKLYRAYTELDLESRQKLKGKIEFFEKSDFLKKKEIREGFNKSLGPLLTNSCPVCGK